MSTPLKPPLKLTDPGFRYFSSAETDLKRTFAKCPKYREFLDQQQKRRKEAEALDDRR